MDALEEQVLSGDGENNLIGEMVLVVTQSAVEDLMTEAAKQLLDPSKTYLREDEDGEASVVHTLPPIIQLVCVFAATQHSICSCDIPPNSTPSKLRILLFVSESPISGINSEAFGNCISSSFF